MTTADGVGIALYDLGGDGQPLLLVHATGFCAAVLVPMARSLSDVFHCFALDVRAHGHSEPPTDLGFDWNGFALDVKAAVDGFGLEGPLGFGHSCGGAALLLAEQRWPGTFAGLYCYEPVIYPGEVPLAPTMDGNPLSAGASRRRETFSSFEEAVAHFSSKPPFDHIDRDALAFYVKNGFREDATGSVTLRCRRGHESAIYANGFSHHAFAHLPEVACDVNLACGAQTEAFGPDLIGMFAARLPSPRTEALVGLGHFGPLEDPRRVAASVCAAFGA